MTIELFAHPFSSYCQKVLVALYENATPFTLRMLGPVHPDNGAALAALWPLGKFPLLREGDRVVMEASTIIEYLGIAHPGTTPLIPADPAAALQVRMMDRIFDNYVMTPQQKVVSDAMRAADARDPAGLADARAMLDEIYRWLDARMQDRVWAAGDAFTLADCGAAPALFYADWSHQIPAGLQALHAYRARLLARPSFARAVDEARPYRPLFPLGAPERD
ncbi:glutathione S-transferase family protein [Blastomonas fulva]|uniref:Glutathione S-transferase n=1 Tax=Blastomonas fulva TaxID=1550728 RepID=A0ABM6M661_9SPHN|nr:glutathione S-transferase family protein [Blastomonas fulva]ASR51381.1 glutathione S-transferase [Blastomonas fulva]